MDDDKQFRRRVQRIAREEVKSFLGTPEGKEVVRDIVQPKRTVKKETAVSRKKTEKAVK